VKPVIFHSQARAELEEAVAYYEKQRQGLGLALQSEVERTIAMLRRNPHRGARYKATEFRYRLARRFPYIVFYTELDDALWIAAIAHGKRKPNYWKGRQME
jgi:toxin ParE1/3/4